MLRQKVTVHFADDTTAETELTQYELGQFDRWAVRNKMGSSSPDRALVQDAPILWMRYGAYIALHRNETKKPAFDAWDQTVIEVEGEKPAAVDPTQTAASDEPSTESLTPQE